MSLDTFFWIDSGSLDEMACEMPWPLSLDAIFEMGFGGFGGVWLLVFGFEVEIEEWM